MLLTIIAFIAILALLVLAHEWGHFFAARRLGVAVLEFGFGFPPRAWGFVRHGVHYTLNWLPLGGFVKLKGEAGEAKGEPDSFSAQVAWRRTVILVAGVTMNVVLSAVLLSIGFAVGVPTIIDDARLSQARDVKVQIVSVVPNSPAAQAGLEVGDTVASLDNQTFAALRELQTYVGLRAGQPINLAITRGSEHLNKIIQPTLLPEGEGRAVMGVSLVQSGIVSYPWYQAIWRGVQETFWLTGEIAKAFGGLFRDLVVHRQVPQDVSGPVGIAVLTGQVVQLGFIYLLQFAALLSLNLAIINILPFPALDGGRVLFVIIEKFRRKPNNELIEAWIHNIGFALLMLLVAAVTYRDLVRFGGSFFSRLTHLFG